MNKGKPLDRHQRQKALALNDPLINLMLINGWRRAEVAKAIMDYDGGDYAYFRPKKHSKQKGHLLTQREKELLNELKSGIFLNTKKTMDAYNKKINRHCDKVQEQLGFDVFHPHKLRSTFATSLSRMGVDRFTVKEAMNHKNLKTTEGYIQPDQEDILEAKELNSELLTLEGMTIHEWRSFALEKVKQIKRLEEYQQKMLIQMKGEKNVEN